VKKINFLFLKLLIDCFSAKINALQCNTQTETEKPQRQFLLLHGPDLVCNAGEIMKKFSTDYEDWATNKKVMVKFDATCCFKKPTTTTTSEEY
jgi:hypothetical protein